MKRRLTMALQRTASRGKASSAFRESAAREAVAELESLGEESRLQTHNAKKKDIFTPSLLNKILQNQLT